jgi:hypothetical protein
MSGPTPMSRGTACPWMGARACIQVIQYKCCQCTESCISQHVNAFGLKPGPAYCKHANAKGPSLFSAMHTALEWGPGPVYTTQGVNVSCCCMQLADICLPSK